MPRAVIREPIRTKRAVLKDPGSIQSYRLHTHSNVTGDPEKWNDTIPDRIFKLALLGCNNEEIQELLDVSHTLFNAWQKRFPMVDRMLAAGRAEACSEVAHSLYQKARGYTHKAEQINYDAREGKFARTTYTKQYPPDTAAAMAFLTNRDRGRWKNQHNLNVGDAEGNTLGPVNLVIVGVAPNPEQFLTIEGESDGE
jgi:hypothetical protein